MDPLFRPQRWVVARQWSSSTVVNSTPPVPSPGSPSRSLARPDA